MRATRAMDALSAPTRRTYEMEKCTSDLVFFGIMNAHGHVNATCHTVTAHAWAWGGVFAFALK